VSTRALVGLWNVAILLTAGAVYLVFASEREEDPWLTVLLAVPVGLAFVGAGLVAWSQRPENRTGLLMTLVGFTWLAASLSEANDALVHTVGGAFGSIPFIFFTWLVLAYPSGRLHTRLDAVVVGLTALIALVISPARFLVAERPALCEDCPQSAFLISDQPAVADALDALFRGVAFAVTIAIVVTLARRWRSATPALRRALTPVFLAAFLVAGALAVGVALDSVGRLGPEALEAIGLLGLLGVPVAFLLGLLRSRLARAEVGRMVVELGQARESAELREVLARGLRDPTLDVVYRLDDDTWIDAEGQPVELPMEGSRRAATFVEHEGRDVAALLHDSSLLADRELLDAVTAAASLSLQNQQRLHALAASEGRTRALLDAIPDLMFRLTPDGTYLEFKAEDHGDLVTPPDEVVGRTVRQRLPAEVAERVMDAIGRALGGEGVQTVEYELTLRGHRRQYEGRIAASAEDEALLIVREITERKEAEAALRAERDLIRTIVDTAPSFFCGVHPDGRIVRFNRRLEELSGLADGDTVRGRRFRDVFVAPADADEWERRFRESIASGGGEEYENVWRTADGGEAIVAWSASWYAGENGADRYLVSGSDVTERHRHAVELQQQHDFLNAIANHAPSLLCLVDERGVVPDRASNVAFERLLAYDTAETGGHVFWERYVDPVEADEVRERMQRVFAGERLGEQDNHWVASTGERLLIAWTCTALPQIDERTLFLVTGVDVTLRKRQEEELRASRARILEAGVSERRRLERNLHDGAQQRLVALSLALRLAKAKLRKDPGGAETLLGAATDELAQALEELRELARGIHPAVLTDRGLAPALEALAARTPVAVEIETPRLRLPPAVEAAAYYVVSEALANVVKYANATSVSVRVEQMDGRVIVGVEDDGVGGADPARGTGLRGLADRVAALDGRLVVSSRPGEGTTVRAEIPVREPALTD
jgi:PAS domain S-box-containing protein